MKDGSVTATYENLKARLPYYSSEVSDANENNLYLYEYLKAVGDDWNGLEGKQPANNISEIYGYWTFSTYFNNNSNFAVEVHCNGYTFMELIILFMEFVLL